MRTIRNGLLFLLCAALLAVPFGCKGQGSEPESQAEGTAVSTAAPLDKLDANAVVLTVGDVPVYATTYRYQLRSRYDTIQRNNLYLWETYLTYVVNPSVYYPYPYYDTRTEEGIQALCEDVLAELGLEAATLYAAAQKGYSLTVTDQSNLMKAEENALDAIEELAESYDSEAAFFQAAGLTEDTFVRMYVRSQEASIDFSKLLDDYKQTHTVEGEALETGYARIVKETFEDRYMDGMYAQYLYYYISGGRRYPSLYIPDDAIFVRLFVHTNPTDAQKETFTALAETDFDALYTSADNEFTSREKVGDLAIAPKDELIKGLYAAAKDTAIGSVGSFSKEADGKTTLYLFQRVEGETGRVPIDRYAGVREIIVNQLIGTFCMDEVRALVNDPSVTVRNEELIASIRPTDES